MAIDPEDLEPRPKPAWQKPTLDPLSIEELQAYIGELEAEIARVREAIARKQQDRAGAESLFRKA